MSIPCKHFSCSAKIQDAFLRGQKHENQRIVRDLHDGLAQELLSIRMQLNSLELMDLPSPLLNRISIINNELHQSLLNLNGILKNEIPDYLSEQSFDQLIRKKFAFQKFIPIEILGNTVLELHEKGIAKEIYRIIQEFVRNSIKHSKASKISIQMQQFARTVRIHLQDDGIGFTNAPSTNGMGLKNIHYRLKAIGAQYEFSSSKQSGTQLIILVNETKY